MLKFERILFPTDLSSRCFHAIGYLAGIARKFDSHVVLLHCFDAHDPFGYGAFSGRETYGVSIPALWQERKAVLAEFGACILNGVTVERVIEDGEPGETISRYVRDHEIDLVVIPTHGFLGFRRLVLGSVTANVLHKVHCPVWTTSHQDSFENRGSGWVRRIVCGVDIEPDSIRVLRKVREVAGQYGAEVRLVHAVGADILGDDAPFQRFLMDTAEQRLTALQNGAHTQFDASIKQGNAAEVLCQAALEYDVDLLVIGRVHSNTLLSGLRSSVNDIVCKAPCPVLSF